MWLFGVRMSYVPKPGWSSECLCQISAFKLVEKWPKSSWWCVGVGWGGGVVEAHFSVQLKPKPS